MLFNSFEFLFAFLPLAYLGYFVLGRWLGADAAIRWAVLASLFFYGWWEPVYLLLLGASIGINFLIGEKLGAAGPRDKATKPWLIFGVALNLASIGFFKYAGFLVGNVNAVSDAGFQVPDIVLPLAISFFTFQQIAYLVDAWRGEVREYDFWRYCLFVTFFPQLIAGPIVHHREMMPQFASAAALTPRLDNLSIGATLFFIGLFKKVVLADNLALVATPVFAAADAGQPLAFFEAWRGIVAYTLQLYFDFSGYSDMAVGLARMFGVRLPMNFYSPYRAVNIVDFWRRWHMTLSRFLRDYLYIPLGGNRKGRVRRYLNLMITMVLGGLWHGASWNFVIWGGLHGGYLVVNHLWQRVWRPLNRWWSVTLARLVTLFAVMIGWTFFRAETLDGALNLLHGTMNLPATLSGRLGPVEAPLAAIGFRFEGPWVSATDQTSLAWFVGWLLVVWFVPNTYELLRRYRPALAVRHTLGDTEPGVGALLRRVSWRPSPAWAWALGVVAFAGVFSLTQVSEFLYFQF